MEQKEWPKGIASRVHISCVVCAESIFTSDHSADRHIGLHRSLEQVCLVSGLSLSSHALVSVPFANLHTTLRFCTALFRVRQRDCKHSVHSPITQCGHSWPPHFSTVSGMESPAFSHKKLSTFCVALCKRTIQCAFRNCRTNWKMVNAFVDELTCSVNRHIPSYLLDSQNRDHKFANIPSMALSSIRIWRFHVNLCPAPSHSRLPAINRADWTHLPDHHFQVPRNRCRMANDVLLNRCSSEMATKTAQTAPWWPNRNIYLN